MRLTGIWQALALASAAWGAGCVPQQVARPFFWVENLQGPGAQLVWDLDSGDVKTPVTPQMAGVLPQGLARYGEDLRNQFGSVVSVKLTHEHGGGPGQWHTQEMAVRYSKSVFPAFVSTTFDEGGRLAGIYVNPAAELMYGISAEEITLIESMGRLMDDDGA